MSNVCSVMPEDRPQPYLRALYVERKSGKLIAVATNAKLAAIELIATASDGPDEHCFIDFEAGLVAQAVSEAPLSSALDVLAMPELQSTIVKTTYGYAHPGNVGIFPTGEVHTLKWRNWFPDKLPTASRGNMRFEGESLARLGRAAPSGKLVFPTYISEQIPCMVRDWIDPNWYGLFFPSFDVTKPSPEMKLPTW